MNRPAPHHRPHSLRRRLQGFVLAAIVLVALVQAASAYRNAVQQADALFDDQLRQMAYSLRGGVQLAPIDGRFDADDDWVIQIWGLDGAPLYRSPRATLPGRAVLGFSDVRVNGQRFRVYTLQGPLQTVQIAQDLDARQARASALAVRAVLPIVLLAPLLMLATWWVIRRSLAPIERARRQLAQRAADDLEPLQAQDLPLEIQPLVQELNQLFARLRAAFDSQRHFIADAAHELRSPLTALKLQAQALRDTHPSASAQDPASAVARLNQGIDRAAALVEQLLSLARQEVAPTESTEPLDFLALTRQVVQDLLAQAQARGVDLGLHRGEAAWVRLPEQAAYTLLRNLLDNAVKYARSRVDVSLHRQPGGVEWVVEDDGPGIAEHERERVFDRFYRVAGTDSPGSGLGLAIVQLIAQRHGIRIRLEHSPRLGGLCVRLHLSPA